MEKNFFFKDAQGEYTIYFYTNELCLIFNTTLNTDIVLSFDELLDSRYCPKKRGIISMDALIYIRSLLKMKAFW